MSCIVDGGLTDMKPKIWSLTVDMGFEGEGDGGRGLEHNLDFLWTKNINKFIVGNIIFRVSKYIQDSTFDQISPLWPFTGRGI